MFKKESLYINVVKHDSQLKLEYKKLSNNAIIETNNSNFLAETDILPQDIAQKLNASQEEIDFTYISTLLLSDTTTLVPKELSSKMKDCEIGKFNHEYDLAVLKTTLFETKNFFVKTGVDYIYSAFHIMNLHLEKNVCTNELLVLIYNDKAYLLMLNNAGIIVEHKILDLPTYESVKITHFYEDNLEAQKLYDEIYYLEISSIIQNVTSEFYSKKKSTSFVEKVTILYAIKQLRAEEIDKLASDLMLKVEYIPVNIDEELFELSRDLRTQKSFVKPRKKRKRRDFKYLYFIIFLGLIIAGLYKFYTLLDIDRFIPNFTKEEYVVQNNSLKLPDHVYSNDKIEQKLKTIFETVPDGVMIENLKLDTNNLEMEIFSKDESSLALFKSSIYPIFENSKIENLTPTLNANFKALVLAHGFNEQKKEYKSFSKEYILDEQMSIERVSEQLKIMFPESSLVRYLSSEEKNYLRFNFIINAVFANPNEFFNLISNLNSELYSIDISYPINIRKVKDKLEIEFNLGFNQEKN